MKRFIAMLLAFALLFGLLSGCGKSGDPEETTIPASSAVTTVPETDAPETEEPTETTVPEEEIPETTVPETTEPESTATKPTEPKPTEPKPTEPKPTEPEPTEPKPTETEPTGPVVYSSFYYFYDYKNIDRVQSEIATFQAVTGSACLHSSMDYGFLQVEDYDGMCDGYNEMYNVFLYQYSKSKLDSYIRYLEEQGFVYVSTENYKQGYSRYYKNAETGYQFDIFVKISDSGIFEYVAIQPYMNAGT